MVAVAIAGLVVTWALWPEPQLPKGLTARAELVGRSFARNDVSQVKRIATERSSRAVIDWMRLVRPRSWDALLSEGAEIEVIIESASRDLDRGTAFVLAHVVLHPDGTRPATAVATSMHPAPTGPSEGQDPTPAVLQPIHHDRRVVLVLFWARNHDGAWELDGQKTRHAVLYRDLRTP